MALGPVWYSLHDKIMIKRTLFVIISFVFGLILNLTTASLAYSEELSHAKRSELKAHLKLGLPSPEYIWSYPKRIPNAGNDVIQFQNQKSLVGLPNRLKKLTSNPWFSLIAEHPPSGSVEMVNFSKIPLLNLYVADLSEMSLYHETSFTAVSKIVNLSAGEPASGILNSENLHFTNQTMNPAFYTHIDPGNSLELGLPKHDVLLDIRLHPKKDVVVLELFEPVDQNQIGEALTLLTGDNRYWVKYKRKMNVAPPYDFDLFHNAIVTALREIYGIPVDLMIYVKDYAVHTMGPTTRNIFSWAVLFDRDLLNEAKVPKLFDDALALSLITQGDGVDESQYVPLGLKNLELYIKNPGLRSLITEAISSSAISQNSELSERINKMHEPMSFWKTIYEPFMQDLFSPGSTLLEDLMKSIGEQPLDSNHVNTFLATRLIHYWDHALTSRCLPALKNLNTHN